MRIDQIQVNFCHWQMLKAIGGIYHQVRKPIGPELICVSQQHWGWKLAKSSPWHLRWGQTCEKIEMQGFSKIWANHAGLHFLMEILFTVSHRNAWVMRNGCWFLSDIESIRLSRGYTCRFSLLLFLPLFVLGPNPSSASLSLPIGECVALNKIFTYLFARFCSTFRWTGGPFPYVDQEP